jgi:uncharacterized protein
MTTANSVREQLLGHINELQIIDSHEHLPQESDRPGDTDVLAEWLTHYFSCDLVSAGLSDAGLEQARDSREDLQRRWQLVEPYWDAARSTGYGRSLDLGARAIYGVDGVSGQTIGALDEAYQAARAEGGHYRRVLKEKSGIALSVVDSNLDCDREFFASAFRLDHFIMPNHRAQIRDEGRAVGLQVHTLEDWEEALALHLDRIYERGAVVVKHGLAYQRSLYYEKVTRADAERDFQLFFANEHAPVWRPPLKAGKALQNHMMHALLRLCDQRQLTMQVHTGIQEGNGNVITDSNPANLTNCFLEYENVTFDLFHMGYPYTREIGNLAKNFRNVNIDMCWGHIVSPEAARRALTEWLDAVPANKIIGFGGDYCFVDGVYGHQRLARDNVATALAAKVADGTMDLERARLIADWLLVDNPRRILRLEERV